MRRILEDLKMEETPADDLARPAPPHKGAGGGFKRFAHSAGPPRLGEPNFVAQKNSKKIRTPSGKNQMAYSCYFILIFAKTFPKWPENESKMVPQSAQNGARTVPKWAKIGRDGPTMAQDGPKMAKISPRWPKIAPEWTKIDPRWPKMAPKLVQDGSKLVQDGPKMSPRGSKIAPR